MEADKFQIAVITELAALKYVLEQVGKIALLAAAMRPEHVAAMCQAAQEKLPSEIYPGLEQIWSRHLGAEIAASASAILTNIETAVADAYREARPRV
jgi:hypothetical protein